MFIERLIVLMNDTRMYGIIGINLIGIVVSLMYASITPIFIIVVLDGVWIYRNSNYIDEFVRGN